MSLLVSAGQRLRDAVASEQPLQMVGTVNAFSALLAEQAGFQALYLSGGGVAAASLGVPDLAISTLDDVLTDARRITDACSLPLLVDADVGWGSAFNIARATRALEKAGAAGLHLEDQVSAKRCGHRPNKAIVSQSEMCDRIKAAVDARRDAAFVIMARTDALAVEGETAALERAAAFIEAGADMVFPEALTKIEQYHRFATTSGVPILANITEFGATPLFTLDQLRAAEVAIALYPLTAFRAMSQAADSVYRTLREHGTQRDIIEQLQTRESLYQVLGYHEFEQKLDALFARTTEDEPL